MTHQAMGAFIYVNGNMRDPEGRLGMAVDLQRLFKEKSDRSKLLVDPTMGDYAKYVERREYIVNSPESSEAGQEDSVRPPGESLEAIQEQIRSSPESPQKPDLPIIEASTSPAVWVIVDWDPEQNFPSGYFDAIRRSALVPKERHLEVPQIHACQNVATSRKLPYLSITLNFNHRPSRTPSEESGSTSDAQSSPTPLRGSVSGKSIKISSQEEPAQVPGDMIIDESDDDELARAINMRSDDESDDVPMTHPLSPPPTSHNANEGAKDSLSIYWFREREPGFPFGGKICQILDLTGLDHQQKAAVLYERLQKLPGF